MKYVISILLLIYSMSILAEDSRWIDLEWDIVEDAKEYELELLEENEGEEFSRGKFKVNSPKWSHAVNPGKYFLRIRSVDDRGVPGDWSEKIPLKVKILSPTMIRPSPIEKLNESLVSFEWSAVPQASSYQLVIRNSKNEVLQESTFLTTKEDIYLKDLGQYTWAVFAIGDGDEALDSSEWPSKSFRKFERVGGELDSPVIKVEVDEKVNLEWRAVNDATNYEIDFFPPPKQGEKNRRFQITKNFFSFSKARLKEGVTTLTIRSQAPRYQDSAKSIIKIVRKDENITSSEVEIGSVKNKYTALNQIFWRHQLYYSLGFSRHNYSSESAATDTKLDQNDVKGFGSNIEWYFQQTPKHNQHKLDISYLNLSSGNESGSEKRAAYNYIFPYATEAKIWSIGAGVSYLDLPVFIGNRTNGAVKSDSISSLGPEFILSMVDPLSVNWHLLANFVFAYHPLIISSPDNAADPFAWMRVQVRFMRLIKQNNGFFLGVEYQRSSQTENKDTSELSGWAGVMGIKHSW